MTATTTAVVGLGANLGQTSATLEQTAAWLAELAPIRGYSRVYRSPAMGRTAQPDFLNAAVALDWSESPERLLRALQAIERRLGRVRRGRWGPRTIDLDLLWVDGVVSTRRDVCLPHPRLMQRAFALIPLTEVVPDARDPRSGRPYICHVPDLAGQRLHPLAARGPWRSTRDPGLLPPELP